MSMRVCYACEWNFVTTCNSFLVQSSSWRINFCTKQIQLQSCDAHVIMWCHVTERSHMESIVGKNAWCNKYDIVATATHDLINSVAWYFSLPWYYWCIVRLFRIWFFRAENCSQRLVFTYLYCPGNGLIQSLTPIHLHAIREWFQSTYWQTSHLLKETRA